MILTMTPMGAVSSVTIEPSTQSFTEAEGNDLLGSDLVTGGD